MPKDEDNMGAVAMLYVAGNMYMNNLANGVDRRALDKQYKYLLEKGLPSTLIINIPTHEGKDLFVPYYLN